MRYGHIGRAHKIVRSRFFSVCFKLGRRKIYLCVLASQILNCHGLIISEIFSVTCLNFWYDKIEIIHEASMLKYLYELSHADFLQH